MSQIHHYNGYANGGVRLQNHSERDLSTLSMTRSSTLYRNSNGLAALATPVSLHEDAQFQISGNNRATLAMRKATVWMRPHELCARPIFRTPVPPGMVPPARELPDPGGTGDPNLLGAIGVLAQLPRLLDRVIPPGQSFDPAQGYCGMFRFRFWQWGSWVEICVDDRLACRSGKPARMHSAQPDVFWAALLEKAYAKLYGGYSALRAGSLGRALQDLTGCVVQCVQPGGPLLAGALPRSTLLVATINTERDCIGTTSRNRTRQSAARCGLLTDHPYCVSGLARVRAAEPPSATNGGHNNGLNGSSTHDTALVRLQSPWGRGSWLGAWAERSWEWSALPQRDKELLAPRPQHDGEFWMSVTDFCARFTSVWLAHVGPDDWALEAALHARAPWRAALALRQWRAGFNAGGGPKYIETTATNPQFRVRVPAGAPCGKAHVVVAVAQRYECSNLGSQGSRSLQNIGFALYEAPPAITRLTPQYICEQAPLDYAPAQPLREVASFFALPPGDFVVLPHCGAPHREASFLLRIFADQHADVWEVNEDNLVIHNVAAEFSDERLQDARLLARLRMRYPPEVTALQLRDILRSGGCCASFVVGGSQVWPRAALGVGVGPGPSIELCRGLLALRDPALAGLLPLQDVPTLVALLRFWKAAFRRYASSSYATSFWKQSRACSYDLRALLWAGGATASNKVLEALSCRFSRNNTITLEGYLMAMTRLHLAHERYHSLDAKAKANPLSLEEMILMTIYS
ncbi:calpain-11-like isoform X2 [Ctenocephalides felis]|uniref:calpain-11-like isoform X2 n=1 Tax=Ctenocephalides felis TaxID=7515 RepID=UPI000E6E575F|nr:calpain-11-like isoform X2 [Ctenocephalides felis]